MDLYERITEAIHGEITFIDRFGNQRQGLGTDVWIEKVIEEDCIAAWQIIAIVLFAFGIPTRSISHDDERKIVADWEKELKEAVKYHRLRPRNPVTLLYLKYAPKDMEWVVPLEEADQFMNSVGHSLKVTEVVKHIYAESSNQTFTSTNESHPSSPVDERPLATRERNTLLCIIAALCKDANHDWQKAAKTATAIQSTAAQMGISIGETTIENHLKKVPEALASRMK